MRNFEDTLEGILESSLEASCHTLWDEVCGLHRDHFDGHLAQYLLIRPPKGALTSDKPTSRLP